MTRVFIALGSNLHQPLHQIECAIIAIKKLTRCSVSKISQWYQSTAIGPGDQPDYINGVIELKTDLCAMDLLKALQAIENQQQRERTIRWGPRTLDLDILLFGDDIVDNEALTIPHPRMCERNFVLYPLYDIAPNLLLPTGEFLRNIIPTCTKEGLNLVKSPTSNTMREKGCCGEPGESHNINQP